MNPTGTILLPIAGRSSRFPGLRPKWMLTAPSGQLMLELSLNTVADRTGKRIVIGGLRDHLADLHGLGAIRRALGDRPEIVTFDSVTSGPAETVSEMIRRAEVSGPVFVKDCDSWFVPEGDVFDDVVCYADLRSTPGVRNIPGKSFVHLNENSLVEGILEKQVSSNFISVGGYGFHDAAVFQHAYLRLKALSEVPGELFVSHVIIEAMRSGAVFRGVQSHSYEDVGTLEAWDAFRKRHNVYFVDIDGVVLKNAGQYVPPLWDDPDVPLTRNVETLKQLLVQGAQIIFVTARSERYREKTEQMLRQLGLSWHACIFGVHHSTRTLINDYAASNPYPSAIAINLGRNDDALDKVLC